MFKRKKEKLAENRKADIEAEEFENEEKFFVKLPLYESLKKNIDKRDPIKEEVVKLLKSIDLFKDLKDRELKKLYTIFHFREYKKNEYVFHEGNPCGGVFIVRSGEISIQKTQILVDKSDRSKMKRYTEIYAKMSEGGMFGEMAFMDEDAHRTTDAVCTQSAEVIVLFVKNLLAFFKKEPVICQKVFRNIISIQGQKLRNTNHELLETKLQNKKLTDYINALSKDASSNIKSVEEIISQEFISLDRS